MKKKPALVLPIPDLTMRRVEHFDEYGETDDVRPITTYTEEASVLTSAVSTTEGIHLDLHKPVLDIDFPVVALPSSTPGHSHLYIDKAMPWDDYEKLLVVLVEIGLLEEGYLGASRMRHYTAVRAPWVKKEIDE